MKFTIIAYNFISKTTGYYHFDKEILIGGGEIYLYYLINFLKKEGHEIHLIQVGEKNEVSKLDEITIESIKMPFSFKDEKEILNRYVFFNLLWKKSKLWKTSDKIHFHEYLNAFPHGNKKMTGTSHGINWDDPRYTKFDSFGLKLRFYRTYIRFLAKQAIKRLHKIAANDTMFLRFVQSEMPLYREKVDVILNFVDTELFNPKNSGDEIRKKFGEDKFIILYPRNFGYGRGGIQTIEVINMLVKEYPNLLLLMTGDGPEKPLAEMKVRQYNLENNVKFVGHSDHFKEMPSLFAAADIVMIPTISVEGTSLACLEAMATQKPVVVTNIGGLPDIVINEFNGLVAKPNQNSLSEKLKMYLQDKNLMESMAKNGYEWVKKYHNYNLWCKKYKEFFDI